MEGSLQHQVTWQQGSALPPRPFVARSDSTDLAALRSRLGRLLKPAVKDQSLRPQLADPQLATSNPTLTTVALEKPFCMFDSSLSPNKSYSVYLYAMMESAIAGSSLVTDHSGKPLNSTFQQMSGGQLGPYKAAVFSVPNCASPPNPADAADINKVADVLKQYLFRVGDDGTCLHDPNFLDVCNPPLAPDTTYRFKYTLVDNTDGIMKDQTLWSDPIKTRRGD
ncbi:PREDICTED: uroplakin-3a [Tinamus guttatus]|uniref:uroplakin-3a n=1 Tax=Tinamus guttatus TaxID=94827 RepID=UPI00052F3F8B|nr:PREDICTED: uroplakin-3a [Tinamus guttatus]